jgi:hypothetical protein
MVGRLDLAREMEKVCSMRSAKRKPQRPYELAA